MKWTILFVLILLILGLMFYPEETKSLVGYVILGTRTVTGYAIRYGPELINRTASILP
jgi:hypothetical protein